MGEGRKTNIDVREKQPAVASPKGPDYGSNPQPFDTWHNAPTN